jgi:hypothetical protein
MLQSALFHNRVHLKRYWRILGELGLFRSVFLITLLLAGIIYTSRPQLLTFQSIIIVFTIANVHFKRDDQGFLLNLHLNKPVFFITQYTLLTLPFTLFYATTFNVIPFTVLTCGIILLSFINLRFKKISLPYLKINFSLLPPQSWEWRTGLRRSWLIILSVWVVSIIFHREIVVLILSVIIISLLVADFQSYHEQKQMIQALQWSVHEFLIKKLLLQSIFFTILVAPLVIIASIQFPDSLRPIFMAFFSSFLVQLSAVLFKYSSYIQGEKTNIFMGILLLLNLSFLFPPIAPLPLILGPFLYRKAAKRLNTVIYV